MRPSGCAPARMPGSSTGPSGSSNLMRSAGPVSGSSTRYGSNNAAAGPSRFDSNPMGPSGSAPGSRSHSAEPRKIVDSTRLFVGNLAPVVDEYTLIQVFSKCGKIAKLDFLFHKTGPLKGKPRGYAFVEYDSKQSAQKAVDKLHGKPLRGKELVVTPASVSTFADSPGTSMAGKPFRRGHEPPKTTTLSLLKKQQRAPGSTEAQIAALEAKLAVMSQSPLAAAAASAPKPGLVGSAGPGSTADTSSVDVSREGSAGPSRLHDSGDHADEGGDTEMEASSLIASTLAESQPGQADAGGNSQLEDDGLEVNSRQSAAQGSSTATSTPIPEKTRPTVRPEMLANAALPSKPSEATLHAAKGLLPPSEGEQRVAHNR